MAASGLKRTADEIAGDCKTVIKDRSLSPPESTQAALEQLLCNKCEETAKAIRSESPGTPTRVLELDFGSLAPVRKAAAEINSYQSQFAIDHDGHFLFTNLIMPKLLAAPYSTRVINVSSDGHCLGPVRLDEYGRDNGKTYGRWCAYGQAISANMLFALDLAIRLGKKGNG
ncbi:MAG: hypothetical protein Q9188_003596 [Gyalolechia gomerana]